VWLYVAIGELRRKCGRGACWTAAIRRLKFFVTRLVSVFFLFSCCAPVLLLLWYPREKYSSGFNEGPSVGVVATAGLLLSSLG